VVDAHCHAGRFVAFRRVFFDGHERIRLHRVNRAVGKRNARVGIGSRLHQISFIKHGAKVRLHPSHRVHFFHLDFAVQINELGVFLVIAQRPLVRAAHLIIDLLDYPRIQVGFREVHTRADDRRG